MQIVNASDKEDVLLEVDWADITHFNQRVPADPEAMELFGILGCDQRFVWETDIAAPLCTMVSAHAPGAIDAAWLLVLSEEWEALEDEAGRRFYRDLESGKTQWEWPCAA